MTIKTPDSFELGTPRREGDLPTLVRRSIEESLASGDPKIVGAAAAAKMSVRTLQRHLSNLGYTYHQLLDEVRMEAAIGLLVLSEISIADAADRVGYSDPAHFTRAFKRWTGELPSAFRQRIRCGRRRRL